MIIVLISCSINVLLFNILIVSGSSIPFNTVFPNKTCLQIIYTIFEIVIFVSDEHLLKAYLQIAEKPNGIIDIFKFYSQLKFSFSLVSDSAFPMKFSFIKIIPNLLCLKLLIYCITKNTTKFLYNNFYNSLTIFYSNNVVILTFASIIHFLL